VVVGLGLVTGLQLSLVRATVLGVDFGAALHTALPWVASLATAAAAGTLWLRRPPLDGCLAVPDTVPDAVLVTGDAAPPDDAEEGATSADADAPARQIPA
jgi:hypothetical protein